MSAADLSVALQNIAAEFYYVVDDCLPGAAVSYRDAEDQTGVIFVLEHGAGQDSVMFMNTEIEMCHAALTHAAANKIRSFIAGVLA